MAKFHSLTVSDVHKETDDSVAVTFAVPDSLKDDYQFTQGQHLTLKTIINGEECRRSYSICAGADEGVLRVAIKAIPEGVFSGYANNNLAVGTAIDVMTPMGHFFTELNPDSTKTYVGFAAGSGITPLLSIIKTTLAREPKSRFHLFYGNKSVSSIMFREELEDIKNRYMTRFSVTHILSREYQETELFFGRIDGEKAKKLLSALCPLDTVDDVFLCGPQNMIEDVVKTFEADGFSKDHLHYELFYTDAAPAVQRIVKVESVKNASRVSIILNGVQTEFDLPFNTDTILDAAQKQGADVPFACKSGVCCTCRAKVKEGKVDMAVNYALEPHEVDEGFVLTCQTRPLTDRVVIDYDQA